MELKRYVLLSDNTILTKKEFEEQKKVDDWFATRLFIKTSDNILDLVEPCKLWDLNGDLYEYTIEDFVFIEKVYDDTDFSTKEVKAIYKRQANGDYKRYDTK